MKRMLLVAGGIVVASAVAAFGADEVKVGGGGASIATVFKPLKPHFDKESGMTLVLAQSTPKNGLIDLVNGVVDVATAAVPLESMIKGAEKDGVKVDPAAIKTTVLAKNRTVLFVHPTNPVQKLSKEQIKGIFTGKIVSWKEVGGSDTPILVAWGKLTPGQNAQFSKEMLDGEPVTKDVVETTDYKGIKETVAATPEAVGIDPYALSVDGTVKAIVTEPEMVSDIIAITKANPSPKAQKILSYVSGEGSKHIIK